MGGEGHHLTAIGYLEVFVYVTACFAANTYFSYTQKKAVSP